MTIRLRKNKQENEANFERLVAQESLILEATEEICRILDSENITRSELAKRLGKSKGFVTQVLSGERNMTLNTMADFAFALGHRLHVRGAPTNRRLSHIEAPTYLPIHSLPSRDLKVWDRSSTVAATVDLSRMWAQAYGKRGDAQGGPTGNLERWSPATQTVECEEVAQTVRPDHEFSLTA